MKTFFRAGLNESTSFERLLICGEKGKQRDIPGKSASINTEDL